VGETHQEKEFAGETPWKEGKMKGMPKRDGSGKGVRANRGRGGCEPPKDKGKKLNERLRRRRIR